MLTNINLLNSQEIIQKYPGFISSFLDVLPNLSNPIIGVYITPSFNLCLLSKDIKLQKIETIFNNRLAYGICDNYQQVLDEYPELQNSGNYLIELTLIEKSKQLAIGGWKWNSFGNYIGNQNPQEEYLYDEPVIEQIYCFRIYEV